MGERTVLWLSTLSGLFAAYLAVGAIVRAGPMGIALWPWIFLVWVCFFRSIVFLGEELGVTYDTRDDSGDTDEREVPSSGPKDRRISPQEPNSSSLRATSRIVGQITQRGRVHTKETRERDSYPGDPEGSRATRDFADFLRSS